MPSHDRILNLRGAVVPLITVFHADESVDEAGTIRHARYLLDEGVQAIIVGGSSAEAVGLSLAERKRLAEVSVDAFHAQVPVCIATGTYRTRDCLELSQHAQSLGADSIMVVPPYYMGLTRKQVRNFYAELAASVDLPIILYDNPSASGVVLDVHELAEFFHAGLIQGVKLTLDRGDASQVHDLRYVCGPDLRIFYGADTCAVEGLLCGADGWISTLINLVPRASRLLCNAALAGQRDRALAVWDILLPIIHFETELNADREPHWLSLVKTGLESLGHSVGVPRRPLLPLSEGQQEHLAILLNQLRQHLPAVDEEDVARGP